MIFGDIGENKAGPYFKGLLCFLVIENRPHRISVRTVLL